jgi:VWFA-related protein
MTRRSMASALIAGALTAPIHSQQGPVFRGTVDNVPVFVTVTDRSDRLVTNLARDSFQVLDNGRPQPLTVFDNTPQPIRLIVMLDVSGSMSGNLALLRAASQELFSRLRTDDQVRVGTFGREITISPTFTNDRAALEAALPQTIAGDAPTPLWKALDTAMAAFGNADGRRVILVLSDGKDAPVMRFGERLVSQLEVADRAEREEVMIYAIGLRSRGAVRPMMGVGPGAVSAMLTEDLPDPGLGTVAINTGGGYFEIRPRDDLGAAFARVVEELHNQYLLGFAPPARDGRQHRIEVKVTVKDLKPRARRNYRAPN